MHTPKTLRPLTAGVSCLVQLSLVMASVGAQHPVLAPTSDTTIVVSTAALHYSAITIPAGVTVRFVTPVVWPIPFAPAVVVCDGDAIVHGTLSVGGDIRNGYGTPAGWVTIGAGNYGTQCGSGLNSLYFPPQGGRHAGTYGSVVPFSLEGGSSGGSLDVYDTSCFQFLSSNWGGDGGGTLALLAGGRIEIHGAVTADGHHYMSSSGGSGGSILLRGNGGVLVQPTGSVTALGGVSTGTTPPPVANGAPGYIRLDAWGAAPVILGTVNPPPTVLTLPFLRVPSPPQIGSLWTLDVHAPDGAPVFVSVSLQPVPGTPTPFGLLGIDLSFAASLGVSVAPSSHDPVAHAALAVPNAPVFIGLSLWAQGLVVPPALPARLTNTVAVTVQ